MNVWQHLNRIEELTYRLDGAASVVKMVAEQSRDNDHSGALWLASDVINQQAEAISDQVAEAMKQSRELLERIDTLEKALDRAKKAKK
jgi:phosphoribosylaminoimidazole carboxylase (NCAIR synthetase)